MMDHNGNFEQQANIASNIIRSDETVANSVLRAHGDNPLLTDAILKQNHNLGDMSRRDDHQAFGSVLHQVQPYQSTQSVMHSIPVHHASSTEMNQLPYMNNFTPSSQGISNSLNVMGSTSLLQPRMIGLPQTEMLNASQHFNTSMNINPQGSSQPTSLLHPLHQMSHMYGSSDQLGTGATASGQKMLLSSSLSERGSATANGAVMVANSGQAPLLSHFVNGTGNNRNDIPGILHKAGGVRAGGGGTLPFNPSASANTSSVVTSHIGSGAKSKPWHMDAHRNERSLMTESITQLLHMRRPNANQDWLQKLPQMAKKLEEALYCDAESFELYKDRNTLKVRLQSLAMSMGGKSNSNVKAMQNSISNMPMNSMSNSNIGNVQNQTLHLQQRKSVAGNMGTAPGYNSNASFNGNIHNRANNNVVQSMTHPVVTPQLTRQTLAQHQHLNFPPSNSTFPPPGIANLSQIRSSNAGSNMGDAIFRSLVDVNAPMLSGNTSNPPSLNQRQLVNMANINPVAHQGGMGQMINSGNAINMMSSHAIEGPSEGNNINLSVAFDDIATISGKNAVSAENAITAQVIVSGNAGGSIDRDKGHGSSSNHSEEHRRQVLKQQQQRLLLLRHASKCPHDAEGSCTTTPHCSSMKVLWKHIMSCKEQECQVPHCVSSRYVLSHYSKCQDSHCPVCGPVREAIRRSVHKSQNIQHIISGGSGPDARQADYGTGDRKLSANGSHHDSKRLKQETAGLSIDPVSCAIYGFAEDNIWRHVESLQEGFVTKAKEISEFCLPLISTILAHNNGYVFANPVDPVALNIPDYRTIVKFPMDLGTVKKRLDMGYYRDINECADDVRLCFDNAMLYNPKACDIHTVAKRFKSNFDIEMKKEMDEYMKKLKARRDNNDNCMLCGELKVMHEPPVYYCNGKCNQRIRRHSFYYVHGNNAYHWCNSCFSDLRESIKVPEGTIYRKDLTRKKHDEDIEESWVQCCKCDRWVHQICTLFNSRRNISEDTLFYCPQCVVKLRKENAITIIPEKKTQAKDLPHTVMTEFLEQRVLERLEIAYTERAELCNVRVDEVEKCPQISIRQVSSYDKNQTVRDGILQRYKHKNFPAEFPCRSKCVILFQNVDGQDVILFGMYVYEYGHKCPQPNQRRVYISYLDSVHYFRPRYYRTLVYHEILVSYLEYVKKRGFHTAHIWACPPLKGDDYILYCHPQDQKTPKDDRLRQWYVQILDICKKRGIVHEVVDMHTEYLANPQNDATVVPYFEGDYWVGEAENIIKNIDSLETFEDDSDESDECDRNVRTKYKRKTKSKTKTKTKKIKNVASGRDIVMAKFGSIIEPMKDAFFVARLHSLEFAAEKAELRRLEVISETSGEAGATQNQAESKEDTSSQTSESKPSAYKYPGKERREIEATPTMKVETVDQNENEAKTDDVKLDTVAVAVGIENRKMMKVETENTCKSTPMDVESAGDSIIQPTDSMSSKKSLSSSQPPEELSKAEKMLLKLRDDTEDVDDTQECEHFETRQALLNLCQGNHYQFDQLRRAKHTSLMILYHLHNPDAPKFIIVCASCHCEILVGYRHHCEACDTDVCNKCYNQQKGSNKCGKCNSTLRTHVVSGGQPAVQLTEEQRIERNKNIQLHLTLLLHATSCKEGCQSKNCLKMKEFLRHEETCKDGGLAKHCHMCVRVNNLLSLHARNCRDSACPVPKCLNLRELMRQNALLQQQMDDRRRNQMNEIYGSRPSQSSG